MASYYVGEQIHVDMPGEPEDVPIVDEFGEEAYAMPADFDRLGRPEADIMRWRPEPEPEPGDYLEIALCQFEPGSCTAEEIAAGAMILASRIPPIPNGDLISIARDLIDNDIRQQGEQS